MKKKARFVLLSSLALLTSFGAASCESGPSSSTVQGQSFSCLVVPDGYGTITTDKERYVVGETVVVTVTASEDGVTGDAILVNGVETPLEGNKAEVLMVEGGLVLKAEYRLVLDDFTAVSDRNSITVTPIEGAEYAIDDGDYQQDNVFSGLAEGSSHEIRVRLAAKDDLRASEPVTKTLATKSERDLTEELLEQLSYLDETPLSMKGAFSVKRVLAGSVYDETLFDNQLYFSDDHYYLESTFSDDGTVMLDKETVKGEDGLCKNVYLNYDNTLVTTDIPSAGTFDETYPNPFVDLTADDFTMTADGRFQLNVEDLDEEDASYIFSLFTSYSDQLVSLYFTVDGGGQLSGIEAYGVDAEKVTVDFQELTMVYEERINLSVAEPSSLGVTAVQSKSFDKSGLENIFGLLAQGNYTADIVEEDFRQNITEYSYRASGNDVQITAPSGYIFGYHDTDGGLAAYDLASTGGSLSLKGRRDYPKEGSTVSGLLPRFDIDADLFNKSGDTYTLEGRFDLYQFLPRILPDRFLDICRSSEALPDKATIQLLSDSVVISYVYEDRYGYQGTITSTLTDIGSTKPTYDFDTLYKAYTTPTSWEEFNPEFYDLLKEYVKDPSLVPFYWLPEDMDNTSNLISYSYKEALEKDMLELLTVFPNWGKAAYYLDGYEKVLLDAGFEEYEDYHYRKGDIDLFFSFPEIIGQSQRTVYLWIYRV